MAKFNPAIWAVATGSAVLSILLVWLAISLVPWGLLILVPAFGLLGAAALCSAIAFGTSRLEADPA